MKNQIIALFFLVCLFQQAHSYGWSPFSNWDKEYDSVLDSQIPKMLMEMGASKPGEPLVGDMKKTDFPWHSENRV